MTDAEFAALIKLSGLPLSPETFAEVRGAAHIMESMVARVTRDKPRELEPAVIFFPEQPA